MGSASVPAELLILRDAIDSIDAELLQVLARRFAKTKRVGELKASMDLEPSMVLAKPRSSSAFALWLMIWGLTQASSMSFLAVSCARPCKIISS